MSTDSSETKSPRVRPSTLFEVLYLAAILVTMVLVIGLSGSLFYGMVAAAGCTLSATAAVISAGFRERGV